MNIAKFKNMFAATGDEGEVITFEQLIQLKEIEKKLGREKKWQYVLQCHSCPTFLVKQDVLSWKFYKYWEGVIFIDIDKPKKEGKKESDICDWWTEDLINEKFVELSKRMTQFKWYRASCLSSSGKGYHIIGYIKAKWKTENEYMASYIQVYNDIYNIIIDLFSDYDGKEVLSMLDDHNVYPWQKFVVGGRTGFMNNKFDEEDTGDLNDFIDDNVYLLEMKDKCNQLIVNKIVGMFEKIQLVRNGGTQLKEKKYEGQEYKRGANRPLMKTGKIKYFYNTYRYMLVKTLKMFYDKEEAREIAKQVYDDYWDPSHDRQDAYKHIDQIIDDVSYFEPKDWFIDVLVNIGVLDKRPKWDYYFNMDELGVNFLSDIMSNILNIAGDLTIVESPVSSGKTTAIAKMKERLWMVEPYTPIIKNNFVNKTTEFQCLYDDIYFEQSKFNESCNKVVSSFDKLVSIDSDVFKRNNIKYLFVDESHTIFGDCDFRFDTMIKLINKIVELIKVAGVKVIMLTGTPLKEKELFSIDSKIKCIYVKVKRKHKYNKKMIVKEYKMFDETILNRNGNAKSTGFCLSDYIVDDIKNYIDNGYKILIPFNDGDKNINELMIRLDSKWPYLIIQDDFNIYKRAYRYDDKNRKISEEGDMENKITFATKYLSVGVSINNKDKAAIIFIGNKFSAYEIEQYSCRFRNVDIECVWYVNEKYDDDNKFNFKLIKFPSENQIKAVIENTEYELQHRQWQNWDMILNGVLNAYKGIIKENVFELNKLYYDDWTLHLIWYVDSLKTYYSSFANNIYELEQYGFVIEKKNITKKSILQYKEKYKENIGQHNKRICTIALEWINQMDEIYFLNGLLEFKNYEMNIEPFIKMNNFAKWCWFNFISVDNIKAMLRCCLIYDEIFKDDKYGKSIQSKIDHAEATLKKLKERPKDKNYKRYYNNAIKKLNKAKLEYSQHIELINCDYSTTVLDKFRSLIKILNHREDLSELFCYIVDYIRDNYVGGDKIKDYNDVLNEVAEKWKSIVNKDKMDYEYYNNKLKENIDKLIHLVFCVVDTEDGNIIIKDSIFSHFDAHWFDLDKNRMSSNIYVERNIHGNLIEL